MVGGRNVPLNGYCDLLKLTPAPIPGDGGGDSSSIHGDISVLYSAQTLASRGPAPSRYRHLDTDKGVT